MKKGLKKGIIIGLLILAGLIGFLECNSRQLKNEKEMNTTTAKETNATKSTIPDGAIATQLAEKDYLNKFKEKQGKWFNVDLKDKHFKFILIDESMKKSLAAYANGNPIDGNDWADLFDTFRKITINWPSELKDHTITIMNPFNVENIIYEAKNGETVYSFLNK